MVHPNTHPPLAEGREVETKDGAILTPHRVLRAPTDVLQLPLAIGCAHQYPVLSEAGVQAHYLRHELVFLGLPAVPGSQRRWQESRLSRLDVLVFDNDGLGFVRVTRQGPDHALVLQVPDPDGAVGEATCTYLVVNEKVITILCLIRIIQKRCAKVFS